MRFGTTTDDRALAVCSLAGCHFELRRSEYDISFPELDKGGGVGIMEGKKRGCSLLTMSMESQAAGRFLRLLGPRISPG